MPVTPEAEIVLVTDEAICERASKALDSMFFVSPEVSAVYVVRLGSRYAIHPPGIVGSGWGYVVHTDTLFRKIAIGTY